MNDWNELENRWRSWKPRFPSAKLEQRLFGHRTQLRPAMDASWPGLRALVSPLRAANWLAPAMVLFVLGAVLVNQGSPSMGKFMVPPATGIRVSEALDHPQMAAYFESQRHSGHNGWREARFEWTNGSQSLSTSSSVWEAWGTNQLIR